MKMVATGIIAILVFVQTCCGGSTLISQCPASSCGSIHNISYPFRLIGDPPWCGDKRYEVYCHNNATLLTLFSGKYHVHEIDYNKFKIRVSDAGIVEDHDNATCSFLPRYFLHSKNFTGIRLGLGPDPFNLDPSVKTSSIAYFNCAHPVTHDSRYVPVQTTPCGFGGHVYAVVQDSRNGFRVTDIKVGCQLKVATLADSGAVNQKPSHSYPQIQDALLQGFWLSWLYFVCEDRCGKGLDCSFVDESTGAVQCSHPLNNPECRYSDGLSVSCGTGSYIVDIIAHICLFGIGVYKGLLKLFGLKRATAYHGGEVEIGKGIGRYVLPYFIIRFLFGVIAFVVLLICKWGRRHKSKYENIEVFLQGNTLMPIRYSYKEIKYMTWGFKEKLGQGGFGFVYKGKLRSASFVAVKMLNKSKTNGQEFINEVASIGRIYHMNIVRLIGFCVEESNRALVYEFMCNGSLDEHIFSKQDGTLLTDNQIYEISLGIARGIAYLHQGCDMQILHFDIKPHNILLDENFIPKVSDFGLAKLYPINRSIVTLTAIRGTIGYMAPELFYNNIGGISYKADIYSFGMLLMEMTNRRRNLTLHVDHSTEHFFPLWIYDHLNRENETEIEDITMVEYDNQTKKMFLVALWCIQLNPSDRPSMNNVLQMLEGELENIKMPPKPALYPHEMIQNDIKSESNQSLSNDSVESSSYLEESIINSYLESS